MLSLIIIPVRSHKSNLSNFTINYLQDDIEIIAEFPWNLRESLLNYNPNLKNATTKKEFEESLFNYIKENLILKDIFNNNLLLKNVIEQSNNNHSHQFSFLISFEKKKIKSITNSIMFNIYANQINHHILSMHDKDYLFTTSYANPTFVIPGMNYWFVIYTVLSIMIIILIYIILRKVYKL